MVDLKDFNARNQRDHIVDWIKKYFADNGDLNTTAVIGISGGKDSTVAAALLCEALGPDRVVAVLMPEGEQMDIMDSYKVVEALDIPSYNIYEINIGPTLEALYSQIGKPNLNDDIRTNTPARIRMTTLYMIAAKRHGRVCHTGNRSEAYVGYTTKYGDLAGDFSLFYNYTATEVVAIGDTFKNIPRELTHKAPSDGMSGKTDEEKLGFSYDDLDNYILNGVVPDVDTLYKINFKNKISSHKRSALRLPCPSQKRPRGEYF